MKRWVALPNGKRAGRDAPTGARRKRFRRNLPRRFRAGLSLSRKGPRRPRLCASADPDIRRISGTARSMLPNRSWEMRVSVDAQAGMLSAEASSAICVQRFDDSRNSAIHTTYRISLRSSSLREPRYPLLRVVLGLLMLQQSEGQLAKHAHTLQQIQTYF